MKTLTTMVAITLIAFTARASEPVPYVAMPIDNAYAIDAHGKRQPNAVCARDVIWACAPRYPAKALSSDPASEARNHRRDGLYRLDIDLKTGRVSKVTIIKSAGLAILDRASTWAFNRLGVQTRQVVGNDNPYHCANNLCACSNSNARSLT